MTRRPGFDSVDASILLALAARPRATVLALAQRVALSRNTVQARLSRWDHDELLLSFERRINPEPLGYPLTAFITASVMQRQLDVVADALRGIPEVLEVHGVSGERDLLIRVVGEDADDLYRVAGSILAIPGVERTSTALVMRQLVEFRMTPLLEIVAQRKER